MERRHTSPRRSAWRHVHQLYVTKQLDKRFTSESIMTKSVRIRINLKHLPDDVRKAIPHFNAADDAAPISPLARTSIETLWGYKQGTRLATAIDVEVVLSNATTLPQFPHGTSVYAVGRLGLELARIELSRAGLPKPALDALGTEHISVQTAAITYLIRLDKPSIPAALKKQLSEYSRLLGLTIQHHPAESRTCYSDCQPSARTSAPSATGTPNRTLDGVTISAEFWANPTVARFDVTLNEAFLRPHGWKNFDSWHDAYAEDRYKTIFNMTVRAMFQLDGKPPAHSEPDRAALDLLEERKKQVIREYIAGKDEKQSAALPMMAGNMQASQLKAWRRFRPFILSATGIDMIRPWSINRHYRPPALVKALLYPGDLHQTEKDASSCFCKASWPELLAGLRQVYMMAY